MTARVRQTFAPLVRTRQRLTVTVTDGLGRRISAGPAAGLGPWLRRVAPPGAKGAVSLALITDAAMRRLNRTYRGKDRPTDVLSFPPGDIAIARGVAARQARELGHSLRLELRILALHGLLHLLGYDHETDRGEMGRLEERLRVRAGLPPGLILRG